MMRIGRQRRLLLGLVIAAIASGVAYYETRTAGSESSPAIQAGQRRDSGESAILAAYEAGRSDVWVEAEGVVQRVLADDNEGSRHQRFIVELDSGHSLLFAHNIDLAPRAPLEPGVRLRFRGEYEWNERGGVVHWTHHDPRGRREGGWLEVRGERYR